MAMACVWLLAAGVSGAQERPAAQAPAEGARPATPEGGGQAAPPAGRGRGAGGPGAEGAPAQGEGGRGGREGAPAAAPLPNGTFALTTAGRVVTNLDKTLDFYRQVFGLLPYGSVPSRPLMNQALEKLGATPNARFRQATVRLPNSGLLMRVLEITNLERAPKTAQTLADVGEAHFRFEVTDVEAVVNNLQRMGAQFVTPANVQAAKTATSVLVRDLDGYLLEVVKGVGSQGSNIGAGASPILDSRLVLTAESVDNTLKFYRDILNAPVPETTQWQKPPFGAGEMKSALSGDIGGPGRVLEVREYRNAGSKGPIQPRLQDPGATVLSFFVRNLAEVTKLVQAANLKIVTPEAKPVQMVNLDRLMIQDPNGVFVELIQE
jgi:catechol 2,3-dioxygenase-like lactoylglutathione lyase family enzyme